jgi:hypothetical protein
MRADAHQKVTAAHLKRNAYLYVRQSTIRQVFENTESTKRQYALRQNAIALGWATEQIVVIDSDLGQSGASAVDREGFQRLVAEVGMGKAGIVLGLEVSRLARNSTDWHRLLEICALTDTLILDEDGIYDPAHFNDRLLLGLKGTMSEAERCERRFPERALTVDSTEDRSHFEGHRPSIARVICFAQRPTVGVGTNARIRSGSCTSRYHDQSCA